MADVEPQTAEFLFDLQDFERASGCFLDFSGSVADLVAVSLNGDAAYP
jgi:hypothetical protein